MKKTIKLNEDQVNLHLQALKIHVISIKDCLDGSRKLKMNVTIISHFEEQLLLAEKEIERLTAFILSTEAA